MSLLFLVVFLGHSQLLPHFFPFGQQIHENLLLPPMLFSHHSELKLFDFLYFHLHLVSIIQNAIVLFEQVYLLGPAMDDSFGQPLVNLFQFA
jgi:hypothetical protein